MKLLCIFPGYESALVFGGVARSGSRLCRALARQGADVAVYTTNMDGHGGTLDVPVGRPVERGGVQVSHFPGLLGRVFHSPALIAHLKETIGQFDLVYIPSVWQWLGIAAARVARRAGVPYIIASRGALHPATLAERPVRKWLFRTLFFNRCLRHAAALHYTTEYEQRLARRFVPAGLPSFVVANPLDEGLFEMSPERRDRLRQASRDRWAVADGVPVLLTVARPDPVKRLDIVLDALARLGGACRLVVAGDDRADYPAAMKEHARRVGVSDRVIWTGHLTGDDLLAAYCGADLFVLTSAHENFSNVTAEAMALGLPAIVSGRCGIARAVRLGQAGRIVPLRAGAVAGAIGNLLASPAGCEQTGANARETAARLYRPDCIARDTLEHYAAILAGRPEGNRFF